MFLTPLKHQRMPLLFPACVCSMPQFPPKPLGPTFPEWFLTAPIMLLSHPLECPFCPRTTWLVLTLILVVLLLISTVVNVNLILGSKAERNRHLDGDYVYHPLQEMNGELLAAEKEQTEDTCNPFKD